MKKVVKREKHCSGMLRGNGAEGGISKREEREREREALLWREGLAPLWAFLKGKVLTLTGGGTKP